MPTVPSTQDELMIFARQHAELWASDPGAYGLSAEQADALLAASTLAAERIEAARRAEAVRKEATATARQGTRALRRTLSEAIAQVRAFAAGQPDATQRLIDAQIPPRAPNAPAQPPGTPFRVRVSLRGSDGAVELAWKARNPVGTSGTTYIVRRRFTPEGPAEFVGLAGGKKTFVDTTLPRGTEFVTYLIRGQRSESAGDDAEIAVRFGTVQGREKVGGVVIERAGAVRGSASKSAA